MEHCSRFFYKAESPCENMNNHLLIFAFWKFWILMLAFFHRKAHQYFIWFSLMSILGNYFEVCTHVWIYILLTHNFSLLIFTRFTSYCLLCSVSIYSGQTPIAAPSNYFSQAFLIPWKEISHAELSSDQNSLRHITSELPKLQI